MEKPVQVHPGRKLGGGSSSSGSISPISPSHSQAAAASATFSSSLARGACPIRDEPGKAAGMHLLQGLHCLQPEAPGEGTHTIPQNEAEAAMIRQQCGRNGSGKRERRKEKQWPGRKGWGGGLEWREKKHKVGAKEWRWDEGKLENGAPVCYHC